MASQAPGPGYVWISDGASGSDGMSSTGGYWAPVPGYVPPVTPPATGIGGSPGSGPTGAQIASQWQQSPALQAQLATQLSRPNSGYGVVPNYGMGPSQQSMGRFQFSGTAPVPLNAPVGWGRYPGVDGAPGNAPWLAGQTMPPPKWGNTGGGGGGYTPPPGGGYTPPPSTGGGGGYTPPVVVTPPVTPPAQFPTPLENRQKAGPSTAAQATGMITYVNGKMTVVPVPEQYKNMPIPWNYVGRNLPAGAFTSLWTNSQGTDWSKVKPG